MRIVEYGHIKPEVVKCNHCGAVLEYVPKDFKCFREIYYLMCPICNNNITTDNNGSKFTFDDRTKGFNV